MRRIFNCWFLVLLLAGLATSAQAATVYYVDGGIAVSGVGTSWATAKKTLQEAITPAISGDQIWIKAGTYSPGVLVGDSYILKNGLSIYGGFVGTETSLGQRNIRFNVTTLSGGGVNNSVVRGSGITGVILDGLTITGGGGGTFGGGMNFSGVSGTLANCLIVSNSATYGAGMWNASGTLVVKNCIFQANTAGSHGGGAFNSGGNGGVYTNCVFVGNQSNGATYGGSGVFNESLAVAATRFVNCTFQGNASAAATSATANQHGTGTPEFTNCIFWGNTAVGTEKNLTISASGANTATNTLFQNGAPASGTTATGSLSSDPLFANTGSPAGVDGIWGSPDDGLIPQAGSPALDAGTASGAPTDDLRGRLRSSSGNPDLGPYERSHAKILRVSTVAAGTGDGTTWPNAFPFLYNALNVAMPGDEIWVRSGTHRPSFGLDRNMSFTVPNGVEVYGGFAGSENTRAERNIKTNITILSGDLGSDAVATNNSYQVVVATGACILDGLVIRDGYANGPGVKNRGAGLYFSGVSPTIRDCVFTANTNPGFTGGAVSAYSPSSALFTGCVFTGNSGFYGGAIYTNAAIRLENSLFLSNTTPHEGGAIRNSTASVVIANCTFQGNTAPATSAAIHSYGSMGFYNCIVWSNSPAGIVSTSGTSSFTNSLVQGGMVSGFTSSGTLLTGDPLFANIGDPDGVDNVWRTADDGLFPLSTSPARDNAGALNAPAADIRGVTRPSGNGYDMGCYERRVSYVNGAGGAGAGTSWASSSNDLRGSLAASQASDEVWVRTGIYPVGGAVTQSFAVPAGVGVYGGFNGTETARDNRDWTVNRTTLTGGGTNYHVLTASGTGGVIDGFIVTGGNANGTWGTPDSGGGGLALDGASPTVRNCVFTTNTAAYAGGGIRCLNASSPRVENCLFVANSAGGSNTGYGGALECEINSSPVLVNCTMVGNSISGSGSPLGTAIETYGNSDPTLINCLIWGNSGPSTAIYNNSVDSIPVISYSLVEGSGGSSAWVSAFGFNGGNNKDANPQFFAQGDPDGVDNLYFTTDDGLQLLAGSPAANAGTMAVAPTPPAQDIRRQTRPLGSAADMGCYEGQLGRVSFAAATSSVSEGTPSTNIAVNLSAPADYPLTVSYAVSGGTATPVVAATPPGSLTTAVLPFYAYTQNWRTSYLYLAPELGAAGTWRSLSMDVTGLPTTDFSMVTVRMRHTSKTDYNTPDWGSSSNPWDVVYQAPLTISAMGSLVLDFNQGDSQFTFDGSSNVEVDFIMRVNSPNGSNAAVTSINTAVMRTQYYYKPDDASPYGNDPSTWFGTGDATNPSPFTGYNNVPVLRFATAAGAGLADYVLASGTLTFPAGTTSLSIPVTILSDLIDEVDETVIVGLSSPVGGVLGAITSHTLTITDDDAPPTVQFAVSGSSGAESVANPTVTVTLSSQSARTVTVNYGYTGGTARNNAVPVAHRDVTIPGGSLSFAPGVVAMVIPGSGFSVHNTPILDEDDETAQITLSAPAFATLGAIATHTYTIQDSHTSDVVPSITTVTVTEGNPTPVLVDISLATRPYLPPAGDAVVQVDFAPVDTTEVEVSADGISWGTSASLWLASAAIATGDGLSAGTAADWNGGAPPKLRVRSRQDAIDDGSQTFNLAMTVNASSTDTRYKSLPVEYISVTCHDDADAAGLSIEPYQTLPPVGVPPVPVSENAYPFLFNFADSADVAGQVLHFTSSVAEVRPGMSMYYYETGEELYVSSVNVGAQTITLSAPVTGGFFPNYFEIGYAAHLRITLTSEPIAPVQVSVNSADGSKAYAYLFAGDTLDDSNWNTGIRVWVYPNNNSIDNADALVGVSVSLASTSDPAYAGVTSDSVDVLVCDEDTRGVSLSTNALSVVEGGSSNAYALVLNSEPTSTVTITVGVAGGQALIDTPNGLGTVIFEPWNWNSAQVVTVTAIDDDDYDPAATSTITHTVAGGDYAGVIAGSVTVTADDNDSNEPIVSPTSGLVTGEDLTTADFTIRLAARPAVGEVVSIPMTITTLSPNLEAEFVSSGDQDVEVYFSRDGTGGGFSSGDPAAWDDPVMVTVRGVDDGDIDGDFDFIVVTANTVSDLGVVSPLHDAIVDDVLGTNVDNEAAGVKIIGGTMAVTEGNSDTYDLQLTFDPADIVDGSFNVVEITIATSSPDIQVTPTSVVWYGTEASGTFIGTRTVTVTALNDDIDELLEPAVITHRVTASTLDGPTGLYPTIADIPPNGLPIQNAQALITDSAADIAGVDVFAPSSLATAENGGTATFSVKLKTQPTSAVTIDLSLGGDADEVRMTTVAAPLEAATKTLTFDATNWNTPQIVSVIGKSDDIDDGDRAFAIVTSATASSDSFYSGIAIPDLPGINTDINAVGVLLSKTTVAVTEAGGTDTYEVSLNSQPTGTVAITLNGDGQVSFRVGSSSGPVVTTIYLAALAASVLGDGTGRDASNPALWSGGVGGGADVYVIAIDDKIDEAATHGAVISHQASGGDYGGVPINSVNATITDLPSVVAGVTVTPPATFAVAEASGTASVSVVLKSKPTGNVIIAVASSDSTVATVSTASLLFTPANWLTPQLFTVTGVNDDIDQDNDGNQVNDSRPFSITFTATSFDPNYDAVAVASAPGTATDDDQASITIAEPVGGLIVSEAGATSTFTVVLDKQPVDTVTVPLSVSNVQRGSLSASSLVFTQANWNTPQTVTVTGLDLDGLNDALGAQFTVLTGDPVGSITGSAFDRLVAADVADVIVNIEAANAPPRFVSVSDVMIPESSGLTAVVINDIDSGQSGEIQAMTVTVTSSNPGLIASAVATPSPTASTDLPIDVTVTFTPEPYQSGTAVLTVTITDDTGIATDPVARSTVLTFNVIVTAVNDRPVVVAGSGTPVFIEGDPAMAVLPSLTVADVDHATLSSATLTILNPLDGVAELLQASTVGTSIIASYDTGTSTLSLNAAVPQPLVLFQQVLRTVGYSNTSDDPTTGTTRNIQVVVSDGTDDSIAVTATVDVQATNDPPVLSGIATDFPTIAEAVVVNLGESVDALLAGAVVIADPDNAVHGLAVSATAGSVVGTWQSSVDGGTGWTDFPVLGSDVHLVLSADGSGQNRIRFVPATADENGLASLTWRAWDGTDLLPDESAPTVITPGTAPSPYSSSTLTANITVTPVNDAPAIAAAGAIPDVAEDSTGHAGVDIQGLVAGQISDVDTGALEGVAVTGAVTTNGAWQYTVDGGSNWSTFGTVSDGSATLLAVNAAQTRIRFVPTLDYTGTATITYRAWDRSDGLSSGQAGIDASLNGGVTAFSSSAVTATVTVTPVNDAPLLTGISGSATVATIVEDVLSAANLGVSTTTILANLATTDVDTGAAATGLALVGADVASGAWEYDAGSGWLPLNGAGLNDATARLLAAGAANRIRFVPDPDFTGTAILTLRAWDQTSGTHGSTANASINGGTTAFSAGTVVVQVVVTPANDQPTITGSAQLPPILEDVGSGAVANPGASIASLVASLTITDPDASALRGLAIVSVDNSNGTWERSLDGTTWTAVGVVSATSARILAQDGDNRLRFVPNADYNGTASCVVKAWDQSDGATDGGLANPMGAGSGSYSTLTAGISVTINPVNDAPVLAAPGGIGNSLVGISEDPASNPGSTVASLIFGFASDIDAGAAQGIAVTGQTGSGTWQYSINSGSSWASVGAVSTTAALLLSDAGTTLVRFAPNANWNGSATITYRAWDRTTGSNGLGGQDVSGVNSGGITAISSASATSTLVVSPVNDAPTIVVNLVAGGSGNEESPIAATFTATLGDIDAGATPVQLTVDAEDGVVSGFTAGAGVTILGEGTGTVTVDGTLAAIQSWLTGIGSAGILYTPAGDEIGARSLTFTIDDLGATGSGGALNDSDALTMTITATNDPPVLGGIANPFPAVAEDIAAGANAGLTVDALIGGTVSITDVDNAQRGVAITGATTGGGAWQYSINSGGAWSPVPAPGVNQGFVLVADGAGVNRLRYQPAANENGSPAGTISYRAWDGSDSAANASMSSALAGAGTGTSAYSGSGLISGIVVTPANDAPALAAAGAIPVVAEDSASHAGVDIQTLVAGQISDVDAGALTGIAVTGAVTTNGAWQYSADGGSSWFPFGSLSDASATLLAVNTNQTRIRFVPVTDYNGTATITYRAWDRSDGLTSGQTGIAASPNGGVTAFSTAAVTATVTVSAVNDAPVLIGLSGGSSTVRTITEDVPDVTGVTVPTILAALSTSDSDVGAVRGIALIGVDDSAGEWEYDAGSGWVAIDALTLNVSSALLLDNVVGHRLRYLPDPDFTGSASLTLHIWDQTTGTAGATANASLNGGSTAFSATSIQVHVVVSAINDAPVVDLNLVGGGIDMTTAAVYVEDASALLVHTGVAVSDADSTTLVGGTIVLENPLDGADEILAVSTSGLPITAIWNPGTWTITLSGNALPAEYQQVLSSLTYLNTSQTPDGSADRTIAVVFNDGTANSLVARGLVDVQPVNDPPVLNVAGAITLAIGDTLTVRDVTGAITNLILDATDLDDPLSALTFTVKLRPNLGDLTLNGSPLSNNGTFTVANLLAGQVAYEHGGLLSGADGFALEVDDGNGGSSITIITLTVTGLVPPQVTIDDGVPAAWVEGAAPIQLDSNADVTDTDSANFDGGNITIAVTGGRVGDRLDFDSALVGNAIIRDVTDLRLGVAGPVLGTISGGSDGASLVIGLTINCSPGLARTILRGLTWTNIGDNPGVDPEAVENRVLTITVNDGANSGPAQVRTIAVDPVDDAPVLQAYTVALTPGLTVPGQLTAIDPEGQAVTFALSAPFAGNGQVVLAANGAFTYQHQILNGVSDVFQVTVTETGGLGLSSTGLVSVLVTVPDASAPRITSVAPARAEIGVLFTYTPVIAGFGAGVDYVLLPELTEAASGTVVDPMAMPYTFSGGSSGGGATGTLRIALPAAPADAGGYYRAGILVIDQVTRQAAYQPLLIKIHTGFTG